MPMHSLSWATSLRTFECAAHEEAPRNGCVVGLDGQKNVFYNSIPNLQLFGVMRGGDVFSNHLLYIQTEKQRHIKILLKYDKYKYLRFGPF